MEPNQKQVNVPVKAKHQVKIIVAKTGDELESKTNEFLETICDERRLNNISFAINMKTGEVINIINYSDISPMTPEEWAERQEKQKKFSAGFQSDNLMPNGSKVSKL